MFDKKRALHYILEIAFEKGFTRVELVEGIYDYSHFNRMCNGKESIHMNVLHRCAEKLGISKEELYKYGNDSDFDLKEYKDKFEELLQSQKYEEIMALYENLKKFNNVSEDIIIRQFIMRLHAFVELKWKSDVFSSITILYDALELTHKNINEESMSIIKLSGEEQILLNDIALCEYEMGNVEKAIGILKQILDINIVSTNKSINRSKVKTLYNLSLILMQSNEVEEALFYVERGIQTCVATITYTYLFPLYYNLAVLYHLQGERIKYEAILNICYTLALTQNKVDIFLDYLEDGMKQFNISEETYNKYKNMANSLITNISNPV